MKRRGITIAAAAALAAGCTTTTSTATPPREGSPSGPAPAASSASQAIGTAPVSAADRLRRLADTATPLPGDAKDSASYPYSYLRTQHWNRATSVVARTDETWWRAIDGTGQSRIRRLPERHDLTRMPTSAEQRALAAARSSTDHYRDPGQLAAIVTEPVPTDQAALTKALFQHQPAETGPQALLWAVCDLTGHHYLNQAARHTTLRILAGIHGLTYTGIADDIAGRRGLWFRLDSAGNRDIISIDPSSGRLLVCSQNLSTTPTALFSYSLYLDVNRTAQPGQEPA